ncbi:MAG: MJ1255/VC2487 family glycosyltransferase [Methylohalobius sp. ZOD2]
MRAFRNLGGGAVRLLYGVQGTGNGHLTRARVMAPALKAAGIEVQYLFSSRPRERFFDMQGFGDWWWRKGLTFVTRNGRVSLPRTLTKVPDLAPFIRDVADLDLEPFDLVLTDFEPITAWAARLRGKPLIGMGHQYAFHFPIPKSRGGFIARMLMRGYAPAPTTLGLHWHSFGQPILPPLVEKPLAATPEPRTILVYLPFESLATVRALLRRFPEYRFQVYCSAVKMPDQSGHIHYHPLSRRGFLKSLATCNGVLCNAGFELISEALQAGKKILVKPLAGQWEQRSNAKALAELGWGESMTTLDADRMAAWLAKPVAIKVGYPDVAGEIAAWLKKGDWAVRPEWTQSIWDQTHWTQAEAPEEGENRFSENCSGLKAARH